MYSLTWKRRHMTIRSRRVCQTGIVVPHVETIAAAQAAIQAAYFAAFADHDESAGGSVNLFGSWYNMMIGSSMPAAMMAKRGGRRRREGNECDGTVRGARHDRRQGDSRRIAPSA